MRFFRAHDLAIVRFDDVGAVAHLERQRVDVVELCQPVRTEGMPQYVHRPFIFQASRNSILCAALSKIVRANITEAATVRLEPRENVWLHRRESFRRLAASHRDQRIIEIDVAPLQALNFRMAQASECTDCPKWQHLHG
jgi:hypothetical protein